MCHLVMPWTAMMVPSQADLLKSFHLWVDPDIRALICTRYGCKYALCVKTERVERVVVYDFNLWNLPRRVYRRQMTAQRIAEQMQKPKRTTYEEAVCFLGSSSSS